MIEAMTQSPQPIDVYGIPNCDTVKKARTWLADHHIAYTFHDFKKEGVPLNLLPQWLGKLGHETLINRKGPTWRKLDEAVRTGVVDDATATAVILSNSSVIKRPLVVWGDGTVTVGFSDENFAARVA